MQSVPLKGRKVSRPQQWLSRRGGVAAAALLLLCGGIATAAESAAFNYPLPPREGAADYFTIAENGRARCVIVQPADASSLVQRATAAMQSYLRLATGGKFSVISDKADLPTGMGRFTSGARPSH